MITPRRWRSARGRHLPAALLTLALISPGVGFAQARPPSSVVEIQMRDLDQKLRRGRTDSAPRVTAQSLRLQYQPTVVNPFRALLQSADSLDLQDAQADSIAVLNRLFMRATDSVMVRMSNELVGLPDRYDINVAWRLVTEAHEGIATKLVSYTGQAVALLTPVQRERLSSILRRRLDPKCLAAAVRVFDATLAGGGGANGVGRPLGC